MRGAAHQRNSVFVDGEELVPDKVTGSGKAHTLLCCRGMSLQTIFVALAYLHSLIVQLVYEECKQGSQRQTLCIQLQVHLVFVTKYCRRVLTEASYETLRDILCKVCQDFEAVLVDSNGGDDHVHLLVEYPPKMAVSTLVQQPQGSLLTSSSATASRHRCTVLQGRRVVSKLPLLPHAERHLCPSFASTLKISGKTCKHLVLNVLPPA